MFCNRDNGNAMTTDSGEMSLMMAEGGELLDFVKSLGALDWARFQARCPRIDLRNGSIVEDRSAMPPFTSFRFSKEDPEVARKLGDAVVSYSGAIQWVMFGRDRFPLAGTNWTVMPQFAAELHDEAATLGIPVSSLCEQRFPELGPVAYRDLLALTRHVIAGW